MAIFLTRLTPDEVFTPRSPYVNSDMYVNRDSLERSLVNALIGRKNIIVTGESGSGKTWLYKRVFDQKKVYYETINLANASLKGSLEAAFKDKYDRLNQETITESTKSGGMKVTPGGVGVDSSGSKKSLIGQEGAFEKLLRGLRTRAGGSGIAILVYENIEQVIDDEKLLKSVSDTIILLDDDDISQYNVKICIVGVPTDIRQYLIKASKNITTITNRTIEIPEVARLSLEESQILMKRGFEQKLKYSFSVDKHKFYKQACWKTDRIAQHIHEYCLAIAHFAEENNKLIDKNVIKKGETEWLNQTLSADYAVIEGRMNARDTRAARRNQVLYSIGVCDVENFKYTDIELIVRAEFPNNTRDVQLNIAGNLTELSTGDKPLIRRTPKGDAYRFTSPKYRMCLRTILKKNGEERVEKIAQGNIL